MLPSIIFWNELVFWNELASWNELIITKRMMELILYRTRIRPDTTDGALEMDGGLFCHTVERSATRLPGGEYEVRVVRPHTGEPRIRVYAPKGSRPVGELLHGNGACRLPKGAVIVGERRARGLCIRSRPTFDFLLGLLEREQEGVRLVVAQE